MATMTEARAWVAGSAYFALCSYLLTRHVNDMVNAGIIPEVSAFQKFQSGQTR